MFEDLLDLFEQSAANGTPIREIVGEDPWSSSMLSFGTTRTGSGESGSGSGWSTRSRAQSEKRKIDDSHASRGACDPRAGPEEVVQEAEVLRGVDFDVARGSIFALLGSNGAGKTTVVKILSTLLKADAGTATSTASMSSPRPQRAGVHQPHRTVRGPSTRFSAGGRTSCWLPSCGTSGGLAADASFFGSLMRTRARSRMNCFERFALTDAAARKVSTYSGGMRRRLDIAMSLIGNPQVIFLDERRRGSTPRRASRCGRPSRNSPSTARRCCSRRSIWTRSEQLADRIAILHGGRIIVNGTLAELKQLLRRRRSNTSRNSRPSRTSSSPSSGDGGQGRQTPAMTAGRRHGRVRNHHDQAFLRRHRRSAGTIPAPHHAQPDTIITTTIMPIAFMLLFVYVFGGAINSGSDSYVNYLLPGICCITIASGISYTHSGSSWT